MSTRAAKTPGIRLDEALATILQDAVLPGDAPFTPGELGEVARFVLDATSTRSAGEPAIAIATVSGDERRFMRVVLVNDDKPFLVDSVAASVAAHGLTIDRLVHPVMRVSRTPQGKLKGFGGRGAPESIIYLETARADARTRRALTADLAMTLSDVAAAVEDWPRLKDALRADAERTDDAEGAALLRWLEGDMLTQLGHVVRRRDGSIEAASGICRAGECALLSSASYDRALAWFSRSGARPAPLIVKSNCASRVHRRVPLDLFIVPVVEADEVAALSIHAGIWTSAALATPAAEVPRLRAGLAELMRRFDFDTKSHGGKALVHALTTLPHDLLISFSEADLERVAAAMMSLVDRPRPKMLLVQAPLERHLFAFVWLPRDAISTDIRLQIAAMLQGAASAPILDWSLEVEGSTLALLRFVLDIRDGGEAPSEAALDTRLRAMVKGWSDGVEAELRELRHDQRAAGLAAKYADSFPLAYRSTYGPGEAARDIAQLRELQPGSTRRAARLYAMPGDAAGEVRLKLYQRSGTLALSDAVPVLENFGFRVIEEVPTVLAGPDLGSVHDFRLVPPPQARVVERAAAIEAAMASVLNGEAEDDAFNRLVVGSQLSPAEANGLRACYRYLRQTGLNYGIGTAVAALEGAPEVTRGILDLFIARHGSKYQGDREAGVASAERAVQAGLARVAAINDDRLLRQFRAVVEAIVRTNAFIPTGGEALAFKLDSALIPGLPKPVPWREIFVYSRRVEGIHLRAGPVARGGIRWSDRRDDYRTEILGLMKAQRVKNAVIVPTGAKGGFFPKQLPNPAERDAWLAEGRASYQVFIRALLSLTDNLVEGKVVHPAGVVVRDGDDPYFVVAADKGTASFSDTANAIADALDFWLEDAFASGGSKGYDHKAMGITARGAWLSVRRHFAEMGVDVQTQFIRVTGCGDMSGDVFGNGMLLSKSIKLVAAFDHRHVFIDPDPDPAKSWAERARLFRLPRSSWADYDPKLISRGGGVWPRTQKAIPLSPEAGAALGLGDTSIDPDSLIRAILTASVDLLWFGGIGTYVKAAHENNVAVGDPANDALRVDGAMIRAGAIGEGANLGCTQAGRIEFALAGGRINTDFIDNSAGVDCSDHEVNIKIALAAAKRAGRLTEPVRIKLLAKMTDEVAALVLEDNRLQALALSIAEARGPRAVPAQVQLIESLEGSGLLDRRTEGLADNPTLIRRAADGHGLTRPELAVLLSSSKLALQAAVEASELPDDPLLEDDLLTAFPAAMRRKFEPEIRGHRLRREIVATKLANRLVNRMGMINPFELAEEEGVGLAQVAAAFAAAERLFGMADIWREIEEAAMPEAARILLFHRAAEALRAHMADLIRVSSGAAAPSRLVPALSLTLRKLRAKAERLLTGEPLAESGRLPAELAAAGAAHGAIDAVIDLFDLAGAIGLSDLAVTSNEDAVALTRAFALLGTELGLDWAQAAAARLRPSDPWERLLVAGLARDFLQMRLEFLQRRPGKSAPEERVQEWLGAQAADVRTFRATLARAQNAGQVTPAMLARITIQARALLER